MRKLCRWFNRIPHLFGKVVVIWCIACMTGFSLYALRILSRTGHDPAELLGVILAPFGGELLIMCLRNVLSNKNARNDPGGKEEL